MGYSAFSNRETIITYIIWYKNNNKAAILYNTDITEGLVHLSHCAEDKATEVVFMFTVTYYQLRYIQTILNRSFTLYYALTIHSSIFGQGYPSVRTVRFGMPSEYYGEKSLTVCVTHGVRARLTRPGLRPLQPPKNVHHTRTTYVATGTAT